MAEGFSSKLGTPHKRYLSLSLQYCLAEKWLTPDDVIAAFPPEAVMTALEGAEALRSRVLVEAAGVHEKIAPKKSSTAAAEDLRIALDEGVCSPQKLLELFSPDEQAEYLDSKQLWSLLTRSDFFKEQNDRSRDRLLFAVQTALDQELLDLPGLIRAVTPELLVSKLPKPAIERALTEAMNAGLDGAPFDPASVFVSIPLVDWVKHVPLADLWDRAIVGAACAKAGFVEGSAAATAAKPDVSKKAATKKGTSKKDDLDDDVVEITEAELQTSVSSPGIEIPPVSERSQEEVAARERALLSLRNLGREPQNPERLATPLLLAIDAMYAELLTLTDDDARADCIRDAFPNQKLLEEALYCLAEMLDPRLDVEELKAKNPGVDSLVQLVLFEERKRDSVIPGTGRSSSPPPVLGSGDSVGLPPLPSGPRRSVAPIPLPPPPPPPKAN